MMPSGQNSSRNNNPCGLRESVTFLLRTGAEQSMIIARRGFRFRQMVANILGFEILPREKILSSMLLGLCLIVLGASGCGQTATTVTTPSATSVDSYFGGPFNVPGTSL